MRDTSFSALARSSEAERESAMHKRYFQCRDWSFVWRTLKQRIIIKTRKCTDTNKSAVHGLKHKADTKAESKKKIGII